MTPLLPEPFLRLPLAHRGLHDADAGRPENTAAAVQAAIGAGYGIEIDVQPSSDGRAMVFHDEDLGRLTGEAGPIADRASHDLSRMAVLGSAETIPTLEAILALVAGRAPLLIEVKDPDGLMAPVPGRLEAAVAKALSGYGGPLAVMSFNPHSVAELARLAPTVPRGLTTAAFEGASWDPLPPARRAELRAIPDIDRCGACFISHDRTDLQRSRVTELKAAGLAILCWTIRSADQERAARSVAQNITFEGYAAPLPG